MFAGIVMLDGARSVPPERRMQLRRALSRREDEEIVDTEASGAYFVRAATGALSGYSGLLTSGHDHVSLLAGQPLGPGGSDRVDHERIDGGLAAGNLAPLRASRGVFCGSRFAADPSGPSLHLFGDKLGVRPIYYWHGPDMVLFATALRILEALPFVPKTRDDTAVAETIAHGFPLADRTRFVGVRLLREGEVLGFDRAGCSAESYWRWQEIPPSDMRGAQAADAVYTVFRDAIDVRRGAEDHVAAFLSGGMDSRAIVSVLHESGAAVQALNFAPDGSQDQVLARRYAEEIGVPFLSFPRDGAPPQGFRVALAEIVRELIDVGALTAARPAAPWSGDGGSVSLGNVYLDDEAVRLMRTGDARAAIEHFFGFNTIELPHRLFRPSARTALAELLVDGMLTELARYESEDPARALHLFLMANDQRRHLNDVYEDLDRHRLEYQLPFFDTQLLELVFGLPLEYRNNHRFYSDLFDVFPASTRAVPWQTYPGHIPCPLPLPAGLSYQWGPSDESLPSRVRRRVKSGASALSLALSPDELGPVSRYRLGAVAGLQLLGLRDYEYAVRAASHFRWRV